MFNTKTEPLDELDVFPDTLVGERKCESMSFPFTQCEEVHECKRRVLESSLEFLNLEDNISAMEEDSRENTEWFALKRIVQNKVKRCKVIGSMLNNNSFPPPQNALMTKPRIVVLSVTPRSILNGWISIDMATENKVRMCMTLMKEFKISSHSLPKLQCSLKMFSCCIELSTMMKTFGPMIWHTF